MARILLVDDDPGLQEVLGMAFEDAGHTVFRAADGRQGLLQVQLVRPDVVVADEVILGDEPNSGPTVGEMVRLRVGWEVSRHWTVGFIGSYQARTGVDHGVGFGAETAVKM